MKRFTETEKWKDQWFRALSPKHKCLWMYFTDNCDQAGVIEPDWDLVAFQIGEAVSPLDVSMFGKQIETLKNGKLFIRGFVAFQYGNLSPDCKPHKPIFAALERHGIKIERVSKGYPKGINTLQEKDKEKEKEKETDVPTLPDELDCPEFMAAWSKYLDYRKARKIDRLLPVSIEAQWTKMAKWGKRAAIEAIEQAIANSWQGIFEPKASYSQHAPASTPVRIAT